MQINLARAPDLPQNLRLHKTPTHPIIPQQPQQAQVHSFKAKEVFGPTPKAEAPAIPEPLHRKFLILRPRVHHSSDLRGFHQPTGPPFNPPRDPTRHHLQKNAKPRDEPNPIPPLPTPRLQLKMRGHKNPDRPNPSRDLPAPTILRKIAHLQPNGFLPDFPIKIRRILCSPFRKIADRTFPTNFPQNRPKHHPNLRPRAQVPILPIFPRFKIFDQRY
jgi:hypothetical protein